MKAVFHWLSKAEKAACGAGFLLLVALVFLSAILRFFRMSVSWNIDAAMLLLAWTAFLGADIAWRDGQIIGVDVLTRALPPAVRRFVDLLIYLIILGALVIMFVFGIRLAWSERIARYQSMPLPYSLVTLSLVTAVFSMTFSTVRKIKGVIVEMIEATVPPRRPERS